MVFLASRPVDAGSTASDLAIAVIAQAMPKSSLKTLKSPERGSFMKPRSTMLEMNEFQGGRVYYTSARRVAQCTMHRATLSDQIGFRGNQSQHETKNTTKQHYSSYASSNIARALSPNSARNAATAAGVTPPKSPVIINARQTARA